MDNQVSDAYRSYKTNVQPFVGPHGCTYYLPVQPVVDQHGCTRYLPLKPTDICVNSPFSGQVEQVNTPIINRASVPVNNVQPCIQASDFSVNTPVLMGSVSPSCAEMLPGGPGYISGVQSQECHSELTFENLPSVTSPPIKYAALVGEAASGPVIKPLFSQVGKGGSSDQLAASAAVAPGLTDCQIELCQKAERAMISLVNWMGNPEFEYINSYPGRDDLIVVNLSADGAIYGVCSDKTATVINVLRTILQWQNCFVPDGNPICFIDSKYDVYLINIEGMLSILSSLKGYLR